MAETALHLDVLWKAGAPRHATVRKRVVEELRSIAWELTQMQALVHDAHQATGYLRGWLSPRMELRLPLYDIGLRYRIVIEEMEPPAVSLVDDAGRHVADVRLV